MVITNTIQESKSVISPNLNIKYRIGRNGENEMRELHGIVYKDDMNIGFVSYDYTRDGSQFSLAQGNELTVAEKKQLFDTFIDDVEQLSSETEVEEE